MGYVKVYRDIKEWKWYSDPVTMLVFLHILLNANWKDDFFDGVPVPRGSLATSLPELESELGLSSKQIRTAIDHMTKTGTITKEVAKGTRSKFTLLTVTNYDEFQDRGRGKGRAKGRAFSSKNVEFSTKIEGQPEERGRAKGRGKGSSGKRKEKEAKRKENINNKNNKNNSARARARESVVFDRLWSLYPNQKGRAYITDENITTIENIGYEEMKRAIDRYVTDLGKEEWRHTQNGDTFFRGGYIDYLDANYQPVSEPKKGKGNSFHNFEQRDYDFEELERLLINR